MEKKIIITQLLYNIKKGHINLFSLYSIKKINKRKETNFKREKNKIGNILKYFLFFKKYIVIIFFIF
jgi:hypothetical protein